MDSKNFERIWGSKPNLVDIFNVWNIPFYYPISKLYLGSELKKHSMICVYYWVTSKYFNKKFFFLSAQTKFLRQVRRLSIFSFRSADIPLSEFPFFLPYLMIMCRQVSLATTGINSHCEKRWSPLSIESMWEKRYTLPLALHNNHNTALSDSIELCREHR